MLDKFLSSEKTSYRLLRTIIQGLVSVAIVSIPVLIASIGLDAMTASIITAVIMCFLSPLMSLFRTGSPEEGVIEADKGGIDA